MMLLLECTIVVMGYLYARAPLGDTVPRNIAGLSGSQRVFGLIQVVTLTCMFAHSLRFRLYSVCAQGPRDTPSARAAQLGPQTLVNLFNSPLYSDVIFMVQGGS